ncbi:MAG: hypothetical protein ACKVZJ_13675 [Phycisphaerales bacterium]
MTIEQIRQLHSARPFLPFTLKLADGNKFTISHPELMAVSRGGRVVHVVTERDTMEHIDLLLVTSVEEHTRSTGNGRRKAG